MPTSTKVHNLRHRRASIVTPPATSQQPYVTKIEVAISRNGNITKHPLYFDEKLTLKEMYNVGFLGDIEFEHPSGVIEKAELEAGPVGSFEGDIVGRFVFRLARVGSEIPLDAHVVKFNFSRSLS